MAKEIKYTQRSENKDNSSAAPVDDGLLFGKKNYMYIIGGTSLIFLGLLLMTGGHMPSPDVWDESLIYSFRRITLAPIVIIIGLIVNIYSIFVKK